MGCNLNILQILIGPASVYSGVVPEVYSRSGVDPKFSTPWSRQSSGVVVPFLNKVWLNVITKLNFRLVVVRFGVLGRNLWHFRLGRTKMFLLTM